MNSGDRPFANDRNERREVAFEAATLFPIASEPLRGGGRIQPVVDAAAAGFAPNRRLGTNLSSRTNVRNASWAPRAKGVTGARPRRLQVVEGGHGRAFKVTPTA